MLEHWQRIPGTQKGSPFSSKGGRTKYKRQMRDKRVRDGDPPWGGSCEGEVFQTAGNSVTSGSVGSFGISEGNVTGRKEKKKKNPQKKHLTTTSNRALGLPPLSRGWTGKCGLHA